MFYKITTIILMAIFYTFYFTKIIVQKKQSIKTNQMGIGNKTKKVLVIERITSVATVTVCISEIISILTQKCTGTKFAIIGIAIGIIAVIIFATATLTMKNNWRVGIPEEKTSLVANGIYSISRNPAFANIAGRKTYAQYV